MGKKILVADDSLTIQKVVELMFSDSGYSLTCVSNGRLALEKVRDDPPDLILADVVMPEKNGYEVCEEIKKNPATARIPVVLLAGTFEPFDRERAERLGCDAIVSKPFDSHQLFLKVESLLTGKSDGGRTTSPAGEAPRDTDAGALRATPFPASVPPDPFGASAGLRSAGPGFVEEDFTGSIRNLRGMGRDEPLENLYGPEDVESALEAFREVEPTARAADWRAAAQPSGAASMWINPQEVTSDDEGRTQRIDTSGFRAPETSTAIAAEANAPLDADSTQPRSPSAPPAQPHELSDKEIERIAEKVARKLVEKFSDHVVREVAWEVVPEAAELAVRERIRELESGVE